LCAHRRCKVCGFCQGSGFGQKYFGGNAISGSRSGGFSVRFSFLPPRLSPTVHPCAPHATNPASGDHLPIGAWIRACPDTWPRVVVFSRQRPWRAECRLGPLARCSPWPASCRGSAGPPSRDRRRPPFPFPVVAVPGRPTWPISEQWLPLLSRVCVFSRGAPSPGGGHRREATGADDNSETFANLLVPTSTTGS